MTQDTYESLNSSLMVLAPLAIIFFILGIVVFAITVAYIIRLWLVQSATFRIQQDLADIRNHLMGYQTIEPQAGLVEEPEQEVEQASAEPIQRRKKIAFGPPRKVFIWIAVSIPILLLVLFITNLVQY